MTEFQFRFILLEFVTIQSFLSRFYLNNKTSHMWFRGCVIETLDGSGKFSVAVEEGQRKGFEEHWKNEIEWEVVKLEH